MIDQIGFIVIALLLFIVFNGLIIKWHNAKEIDKEFWNKWWHRAAIAIRVCLWFAVWMVTSNWYIFLGVIAIDCILYPIGINVINGLKWYYVGTTSKIDILIRKTLLWLKVKIKLK